MNWLRAVVIGSSGGIGSALVAALAHSGVEVHALSRSGGSEPPLDLTSQTSIAEAATRIGQSGPVDLVIVATGLLHSAGIKPEKSWRGLEAGTLAQYFAVNAIGPALVAKHFLPLLSREGRSAFAALSARVGSIGDNRLGGWHGYRASKAALNMLVKTLAIELARTRPEAICVALHPGTVDTDLSRPFQQSVAPDKLFTPEVAAAHLLTVLERLTPEDSGGCFAWDGRRIEP
jgi:NAD(P)-dependent dehydrogenase (short-subunit alcohol dehydrogenase family)